MPSRAFIDSDTRIIRVSLSDLIKIVLMPSRAFIDSDKINGKTIESARLES